MNYPSGPIIQTLNLGTETYADQPKTNERKNGAFSKDVNRLMSAAAVSPRFRRKLLSDPLSALASGYNGESFQLTSDEMRLIGSIHADSLRNFAAQFVELVQEPVSEVRKAWTYTTSQTYPQPAYEPVRVRSHTRQRL